MGKSIRTSSAATSAAAWRCSRRILFAATPSWTAGRKSISTLNTRGTRTSATSSLNTISNPLRSIRHWARSAGATISPSCRRWSRCLTQVRSRNLGSAKANRELIARRFVATIGAEAEPLWDGCHNSITRRESDGEVAWLHRKGAVEAEGDFVVIPGSRGSLSYIVKPIGDGESHAWSLAHGAGRKWARSDARLRMRERFSVSELAQTPLGGRVVCEERDLLYEEAPAAYKNIETVIKDLVDAGLVSVIATFRPLLTYKTRKLYR